MSNLSATHELRAQFKRLGRDGISQRAHDLVIQYAKKHTEGHCKEACMLLGRLHALYLATPPHEYWREIADRGFYNELADLQVFEKTEDQSCQNSATS